jgi:7-carboxy-7-deazaguanine synthase
VIHLNDLFHTVQGEGMNVGRRSLFVRMPYCNLACSWCDTAFNSFKEWSTVEFLLFTENEPTRFAVITGGEPSMHKHTPEVIARLKSRNFEIAMETNGHFLIPQGVDWVCCSPKRDQFMNREPYFVHEDVWSRAQEFKYVVDDGFDFSILARHDKEDWSHCWLSPEHTNWSENVARILEYTAKNPRWRLNLQTHKLIGVK